LKVLAKEGISFMCFINCMLGESSILQGAYFGVHISRAHVKQVLKRFCFLF